MNLFHNKTVIYLTEHAVKSSEIFLFFCYIN